MYFFRFQYILNEKKLMTLIDFRTFFSFSCNEPNNFYVIDSNIYLYAYIYAHCQRAKMYKGQYAEL